MRDLPNKPFDELVTVHLDEQFAVAAAFRLPWEAVVRLSSYNERVNGWRLPLIRGALQDDPDVEPITLGMQ
jgi:hypothetical protein